MSLNILNILANGIENYTRSASKYFVGKSISEYCTLDCAIGLLEEDKVKDLELNSPYILLDDDRTMISAFQIQGTRSLVSEEGYNKIIDGLLMKLDSYFSRSGHSIHISFERDHEKSEDEYMRLVKPQIEAARKIGISGEDIIIDRIKRNLPYVSFEENLLIVNTYTSVFSKEELKSECEARTKYAREHQFPRIEFGQNPLLFLEGMKVRHDSLLDRIEDDFKQIGILIERISSKQLLKSIKSKINRNNINFSPAIIGDKVCISGEDLPNDDYSNYLFPKLKYQLCHEFVDIAEKEIVKVDEYYHGNISLLLPQQETQTFSSFFKNVGRKVPYRIKIDIAPNGLNALQTKKLILAFSNVFPGNKEISESIKVLEAESKLQSICLYKVTFSTWSKDKKELLSRISSLERAIQSWGICQVNKITGDPLASWVSTIPAFSTKNIANKLVAPLSEILQYLPLQRPATVWGGNTKGDLILRSPDGKIFPVGFGSSLQNTWFTLMSAPPGSGKSVLLNSINASTTWSAGNKELPFKTIVDVGGSSFGYVTLVKDSLPENKKHLAVMIKLQNNKDYAINIFDTQLGCRYLTVREFEFCTDFLTMLCADSDNKTPEGVSKVCSALIDIAYKVKANDKPNQYDVNVDKDVDRALSDLLQKNIINKEWLEDATWFEITDTLFENGMIREATLSHRYAMPILSDFNSFLQNESIVQIYEKANTSTGEPLLAYINRCFTSANSTYHMFNGRTRFELSSETRIVSIDVGEVIGQKTNEGKAKTALMYCFARQLAAKNYFISTESMENICPPLYKSYHNKRINILTSSKKGIAYDEYHNAKGIEMFEETILKDVREGRKWGIEITCISQYLSDYSEELRVAATSTFLMSGSNDIDNKILLKDHETEMTPDLIRRFELEATGPTKEGGTFLAIFRTKLGKIVQLLTNTIGPIELWAFSSTMEDVALRKKLTAQFGSKGARDILATEYPTGTAVKHIEKLKQELETEQHIIDWLADNLIKKHLDKKEVESNDK